MLRWLLSFYDGDDLSRKMADVHTSDAVKKLHKMKEDDPDAAGTAEQLLWQEMEANGFMFKAEGGSGNKMAGRWRRSSKRSHSSQS